MKKRFIGFFTYLMAAVLLCMSVTGCTRRDIHPFAPPPVVAIGRDGLAVWSKVEGALYYAYVIDDGAEQITDECSAQLSDGQTIKVKAVSGSQDAGDTEYSLPQTYHADAVDPDCAHSDVNGDGVCDRCGDSVLAELSFYAMNDLHGKFMDTSAQPGLDEFTTYMKNLYADPAREEILLSSGDMWQGTAESSLNRGKLMTEWMNGVGFVSMTLGNHEFDWGADALTPNSELANFPFLAINVTYNGKAAEYCRDSVVVERGGVKIGVIGAIGNCLSSISGEFQGGLSFATGSKLTTLVKNEATRLRNEEGCDFIVYSLHDGGEFSSYGIQSVSGSDLSNDKGVYYDTSLSDGYVDLVFEGHSHQQYILQDEYGVYHMQGGGENKAVSCADVSYNTVTGEYGVTPRMISQSTYGSPSIPDDPVVSELFGKYFPDDDPYAAIGSNRTERRSDEILSKVAELYYRRGVEEWGSEYTVVLGGGFLNARSPYRIAAGSVTYADIFSVLPFDNAIVLGEISGYYLKQKILNNNNYTVYSSLSASSVSDSAKYYIIVDTYTSTYSSNRITEIDRISGEYARDLLAAFVRGGGWE